MMNINSDDLVEGVSLFSDKYKIISIMGSNSFGRKYLATDQNDQEVIVREFYPAELCRRDGQEVTVSTKEKKAEFDTLIQGFMKDATNLVNLDNPNIANVIETFKENGTAYMVMEMPTGKSLYDVITDEDFEITPDEIKSWLTKLLKALHEIHALELLHRDIEPKNITITDDHEPMLFVDFGTFKDRAGKETRALSKIVEPTNHYASMEMSVSPDKQSPAADIYSLAASFYFAISGKPPAACLQRISAIAIEEPDPYVPVADRIEGYDKIFLTLIDMAMLVFSEGRIRSTSEWLRHLQVQTGIPETETAPIKSLYRAKHAERYIGNIPLPPLPSLKVVLMGCWAFSVVIGVAYFTK